MERQLERCCGLDVHKETIAACVRLGGPTGKAEQHVQTFGTTVGDLLVLHDWLPPPRADAPGVGGTGVEWWGGVCARGRTARASIGSGCSTRWKTTSPVSS